MNSASSKDFYKKIIKLICILYLIFGVVLWGICFIGTNWRELRGLCCDGCDGSWYSNMWIYYEIYTLPFMLLTFPIRWIAYDIQNIKIWSIISIYLPFIPCLILLTRNIIRRYYAYGI